MPFTRPWGSGSGHLHINVSQMEAMANCERKWGFQYLHGETDRGNSFAQFGIIVHLLMENWFLKGEHPASIINTPEHSEVAESGLHHWPAPGSVEMAVEAGFTFTLHTPNGPLHFKGTRDLVYWDHGVSVHIGDEDIVEVDATRVTLGDHKTTTDFRWAKTEAELRTNIQAMVYALATMYQFNVREIELRWVYLRTRGARKSHPVVITVTWDEAYRVVVAKCTPLIKQIHKARLAAVPVELAPNYTHCKDYGGCPFQSECGGRAVDRIKARMAHMNLREKMLARINKNKGIEAPEESLQDAAVGSDPINAPEAARAVTSEAHAVATAKPAKAPAGAKMSKALKAAVEASERGDDDTVVIEDDEPSAGDEVHVGHDPEDHRGPLTSTGGYTLLVGCLIAGEYVGTAAAIVAQAHQKVREGTGAEDYRLIEFGKGAGALVAEVRELLSATGLNNGYLYLDPSSVEEALCLPAFVEFAGQVIRRV